MRRIEFWYEFASTYSYLAAMRIGGLAEASGVAVLWRPFLLGPILAEQGWTTSPFNVQPAKGRYMWRDMAREAASLGLPFRQPDPFPQNGLLPARVALLGAERGWGPDFTRAVFRAEFGVGRKIFDPTLIGALLTDLGLDPHPILAAAGSEEVKLRLRAQCEEARMCGVFGAPSFVAPDGELFWGNDRLEQALAWVTARPAR